MDANRWASEFVSLHGGDHELMRAWFANALMCGWDNHYWTTPEYEAVVNDDITRAAELLQQQALPEVG